MAQYKTVACDPLITTGSLNPVVAPINKIIQDETKNGWKLHSITPVRTFVDQRGCLQRNNSAVNIIEIVILVFVKDDEPTNKDEGLSYTSLRPTPTPTPTKSTTFAPKETKSAPPTPTPAKKAETATSTATDDFEKQKLYSFAMQQIGNRSYQTAYNCLSQIKGYRDADEILENIKDKI
ncbi:MAG: hypothetical protein IKA40_02245 [Clostridia bacterium]|nr:hypothetical protein [Clostridia bacterium]